MTIAIVSALGLFSATRVDAQASPPANVPPPAASAPAVPSSAPNAAAPSPVSPAQAGQATPPAAAAPPVAPPPAAPAVVAPVVSAPPTPAQPPPKKESNYDGPPLLFGGGKIAVGGYGGPTVAYTPMLDRDGALIGIEGALLLAHRLSIGLAGYGFTRTPNGPPTPGGIPRELGAGYGGFVARYAFLTKLPVYPSVGMLIGGGAVVLHEDWDDIDDDHDEHHDDDDDEVDCFFVFQPEVSLHANLTRWMRLGISVGYRVTSDVHRFGFEESDINGVVVGGNMQFGWF